jgi:hypothetical protein
MYSRWGVWTCVSLLAIPAAAHPGHGIPAADEGLAHELTSFEHAAPWWLLLAFALSIGFLACIRRQRVRSSAATPGMLRIGE